MSLARIFATLRRWLAGLSARRPPGPAYFVVRCTTCGHARLIGGRCDCHPF